MDKYFPSDINNIGNVFIKMLDYIINNQNKKIFYNLNPNIQPNRWYLENYV